MACSITTTEKPREIARSSKGTLRVSHHDDHEDMVKTLRNEVRAEDLILVKGSLGMRMEKVSRGLLANPQQAERLLVRPSW